MVLGMWNAVKVMLVFAINAKCLIAYSARLLWIPQKCIRVKCVKNALQAMKLLILISV